jgi:LysM repeat protein
MRGTFIINKKSGVIILPIVFRKNYIYTVRVGDTLYSIAQRFKSSTEAIERANHLFEPVTDPGLIFPGDVLVVPSLLETGKVSYVVKSGDTMSRIAYRFSTFSDLVSGIKHVENPNLISPDQRLVVSAFIYQIQSRDTLSAISRKFGIPRLNITKANQWRPGYQ